MFAQQRDVFMNNNSSFETFLEGFIPEVSLKSEQLNKAVWLLETTGSKDAAYLVATLGSELRQMFSDKKVFEELLEYQKKHVNDPILNRELIILIDQFKGNILPKEILTELSDRESDLAITYANFRAEIDGKKVTENELRDILKNEKNVELRKKTWLASKEVGNALAKKIVEIVKLRNKAAQMLGYKNYFEMQLDLAEVDQKQLFLTFDRLNSATQKAYDKMIAHINDELSKKYNVDIEDLGPWAWKDPFSQMDPIESDKLNSIYKDRDLVAITKDFYQKMGFDIEPIIANSDLYERDGKNQHAFCINIDRNGDVRTLNNIKNNVQWMDTMLHEFGHAIYDVKIDMKLPWLLKEPPHMIPTEAMALFMGRKASNEEFLKEFLNINDEKLFKDIKEGFQRRQLIFSRSVFVITEFEKSMYENPDQDLNKLWWDLVEKYQKIKRPQNRENFNDWAAKYHVGLAPVYYYSYLYGEVFASAIQKKTTEITGSMKVWDPKVGKFLEERLFYPGSKYRWDILIENTLDEPFSTDAWVEECTN